MSDQKNGNKDFPEAKSVAFCSMAGPTATETGARFLWSFTLRASTVAEAFEQIEAIEKLALKRGFVPSDAYIDQRRIERGEQQPQTVPQQVNEFDQSEQEVFTCKALKLVAAQKSEKDTALMWKVQTDKSKYPVPMYEEVVSGLAELLGQSGIDVSVLATPGGLASHDLSGWIAHYQKNEKGWPAKIVNLSK